MEVFYNPVMSLNRDFSILFFSRDHGIKKALDGLAATGVRGVRVMNETKFTGEMHINDHSPAAEEIITRNVEMNGVDATIHRKNLATLLTEQYFDYIDIDPFGSPAPFIPGAFNSIRNRGYLAVTATDTGALCGSYPKAGLRRYGFRSARSYLTHEIGVRGLLGYLVRQAAVHDRYIEPLISQSINHYYRVVVRVRNGAKRADAMLNDMGGVRIIPGGYQLLDKIMNEKYPATSSKGMIPGPFYLGPLHSRGFLEDMISVRSASTIANTAQVEKLLSLYLEEVDGPSWHYDTDQVSSHLGRSCPPLARVIGDLRRNGHFASPTQFSPTTFKTDGDLAAVKSTFDVLK